MKNYAVLHVRTSQNFLKDARQDFQLARWRSCVSNAQMAIGHALKSILALYVPVPRVHDPTDDLFRLLAQEPESMPEHVRSSVRHNPYGFTSHTHSNRLWRV